MRLLVVCWLVIAALVGIFSLLQGPSTVRGANPLRPSSATLIVGGPCGTTIQACINSAADYDTIVIPAGVYNESLTLNKPVSLTGQLASATIVNAIANQRVLTVTGNTITNTTIISGLTFANGSLMGMSFIRDYGGGGLITGLAEPTLQNVIIRDNLAYLGGGLYADAGSPLVLNGVSFISNTANLDGGGAYARDRAVVNGSLFQANSAFDGGGLFTFITLTLANTQFLSNTAIATGGGLNANDQADVTGGLFQNNSSASAFGAGLASFNRLAVTGTQFIANVAATDGGGIYQTGNENARIVNALFSRNVAATGSGAALALNSAGTVQILHTTLANPTLASGSGIYVTNGAVGITNTIIASQTIGIEDAGGAVFENYNLFFNTSLVGAISSGGNSLNADPAFVNVASNYRLRANSPAIDAGVNVGVGLDFEGDPRPTGNGFDIGFDEFVFRQWLPFVSR